MVLEFARSGIPSISVAPRLSNHQGTQNTQGKQFPREIGKLIIKLTICVIWFKNIYDEYNLIHITIQ